MNITRKFKSTDPFDELSYPHGATGLTLRIICYWFATDKYGNFYLLRNVIESMDYTARNGEGMCGVTPTFTDSYWRCKTKADARMLWMRIKAGSAKNIMKILLIG